MAHGGHDKDGGIRRADEAALSARLKSLGNRLGDVAASEARSGSAAGPTADPSALARGIRLSTEFVLGVLIGAGLGWLIDRWLGTSPWGLIVLLLLGFVAGVFNMVRAAGVAPGGVADGGPMRRND